MTDLCRRTLLLSGGAASFAASSGATQAEGVDSRLAASAVNALSFGSRIELVTLNRASVFEAGCVDGTGIVADGLSYVRQRGATAIPDLPDWLPSGPVVSAGHFGVTSDADDNSTAWRAFQAWEGAKTVPAGSFKVKGETKTFDNGAFGNGEVISNLTAEQKGMVSTGIEQIIPRNAELVIAQHHTDASVRPAIYVSSTIEDSSGGDLATKVAGIYSYCEQTGSNTALGPKAICGVSVNAASGDNDSTGIVGYTYKLNVKGGVGDAAGAGGACHQFSTEEGLALGAEFSVHQHVGGTSASPNARNGNNSMAIHVTTNSTGSRAWTAIGVDAQGLQKKRFGFWNGLVLSRSVFAEGGEGFHAGTVGINFGNNTTTGPEKAFYLGNANYHLWRSGGAAIRAHAITLDLENSEGNTPGIRLIAPSQSTGGYFGAYQGKTGTDGNSEVTPKGAFIVGANNYSYIASYNAAGKPVSRAGCSPAGNAFVPMDASGVMKMGDAAHLWAQVYAASPAISTSDGRHKQDVQSFPDAVLDAWGDVGFVQFRFIDAVAEKGDEARLHPGLIAQRVMEAFAARGLDAADYGVLCHDSWEAEPEIRQTDRILTKPEVSDEFGTVIEEAQYETVTTLTPGIAAGERYGIRYEEALCLEAAYQRRRADRLEARIARLENMILES